MIAAAAAMPYGPARDAKPIMLLKFEPRVALTPIPDPPIAVPGPPINAVPAPPALLNTPDDTPPPVLVPPNILARPARVDAFPTDPPKNSSAFNAANSDMMRRTVFLTLRTIPSKPSLNVSNIPLASEL